MKRNQMAAFAFAFALTGQALAVNGAQIYTPVVNNAGTLTLHSSSYEEASKLGIGLNYNLAVDPSETPTSNGSLKTYVHSVNLGIGSKLPFEFLHDRVHAFVDFSGHFLSPIDKTLESGLDAVDEKKFVIGNINLGAGFTIINNDEGGIGLALVPHVVLPVGSENFYLDGPRKASDKRALQYGAVLAVDYKMGEHGDLALLNLGWDRQYKYDYITWGFGFQKAMAEKSAVIFEFRGQQNIDDPKIINSDPIEADLAYRAYSSDRAFSWTAGLGRGFNNDEGSPDLRVFGGINWQLDHHHDHHAHHEEPAAPVNEPVKEVVAEKVAPVAAPVEEKHVLEQKTLKVGKIYFANNKDVILEKSNATLDKLAADLSANPGIKKLQVEGYTDNVGNADYNKALSKKRADSVSKYLSDKGVDSKRLQTEGMGAENPVADNATAKGRAANRRVEFRLVDVDGSIKMDVTE